jgi:hypothetical protein
MDNNYENLSSSEKKYIESLDSKERKAYHIAKTHLGSSFDLIKSNGFIEWEKKNKSNISEIQSSS